VALAGSPPVELSLNVGFGQWQPRRAAVHHHPDSSAMRFAKCSCPENGSEGAEHGVPLQRENQLHGLYYFRTSSYFN
jgi:hypothetical protein